MTTTLNIIAIAVLTLLGGVSASAQTNSKPISTENEISVRRVSSKEIEGGNISERHKCTSDIPSELAKQLEAIVGFKCDGVGVTTSVTDDEKTGFRSPVMLGDSFSRKGIIKTGKIHEENDFSYQFKRIFEHAVADSFVSEGAFRFQNNLTKKERYLICRTRVERDKNGRLVGKTQWIGPINYETIVRTNAILPKLFEPDTAPEE